MEAVPLSYRSAVALEAGDGAPLLVLLHGRGSDERDLLNLRAHLPVEALLVAPRAPFSGSGWGYGGGWAWYRFLGDDRPEPASFAASQQALDELLERLPHELPVRPGPLILGGFSQGGTMSLGHALRSPGCAPLVLVFSGFLPSHPEVPVTPDSVRGTRVFWGHGRHDPAISFALAERGRASLRAAGAELEARDYPIGHAISPDELADATEWLRRAPEWPTSRESESA